nr:DNA/RNA polymerases superfamily protein [Tanacetum cinerariifolium]
MDLMNRVSKAYLDKFVTIFTDDIYSKTKEDHEKNKKYEWGAKQEEAFQTLKDNLCNAPTLSLPNGVKDFVVFCDALNQGLGCKELNMRQWRWIELFSDYDSEICYHPDAQSETSKVENASAEMLRGLDQQMERKEDESLYFMEHIWVLLVGALHGRKCRSPVLWAKIRESRLIGLELVQETTDKGVIRFGKKGKLAPRYAGQFEIHEGIGLVAYRLRLPEELSSMHETFHVCRILDIITQSNVSFDLWLELASLILSLNVILSFPETNMLILVAISKA